MITVKQKTEDLTQGIMNMMAGAKEDYVRMSTSNGKKELTGYFAEKVANYDDLLTVKEGTKYIKIINDGSVWGFVVNTDNDKKFRKGDILKAAGYAAPARNAARGNILDGGYTINWTGPLYL
jgi:hypothetical protein